MYEYNNSNGNGSNSGSGELITKEQLKALKKADRKYERRKTWKKIGLAAVLGLTFGILAAGSFQCVNRLTNYFFPEEKKEVVAQIEGDATKPVPEIPEVNIDKEGNLGKEKHEAVLQNYKGGINVSDVVENCMPSIVSITNKSVQQIRSMWGMGIQEYENTSVGSGIIIGQNDDELLIVTNNHVIEGANSLTVGFVDDEIYDAYVKGTESDRDLAVIAVKLSDLSSDTSNAISIAKMGDSSELVVGEQVVAIGNALGYGQSVTTGIVSALDREVTIENITNTLIQTDAAINPGNSGGALLNLNGELIGINSAKFASSAVEGMGYAIPINTVEPIVEGLMNRATREKLDNDKAGYLGITGLNVDISVSSTYGIPEGVYLQEVAENGPAEKAGLIKGDVIKKVDGTSVDTIAELKDLLLYYSAGEEVEIVYYRLENGEYEEQKTVAILGERKGTPLENEPKVDEGSDKDTEKNQDKDTEHVNPETGEDDGTKSNREKMIEKELEELFRIFGR